MIMSSFSPIEVSSIITMLPGGRDARGDRDDGRGEQTAVRDPAGARAEDPAGAGRRAARPVGAPSPTPGAADSPGRSSGDGPPAAGPAGESATRGRAPAARGGPLPGPLRRLRPDPGTGEARRAASPPRGTGDPAPVARGRRPLARP